MTVKVKEPLG